MEKEKTLRFIIRKLFLETRYRNKSKKKKK